MKTSSKFVGRWHSSKILAMAALAVLALNPVAESAYAAVTIEQQPLTVSNNVPGNLVLTPSVEWPTVMSMSNLGSFSPATTYGGYFDPAKCYSYDATGVIPTTTPAPQMADPIGENGYFVPVSAGTAPVTCANQWSGNYLNWAATQTIDTFRSVMTGGYRVVDTATETVLEKARHTGQTGTGYLTLNNSGTVSGATPATFQRFATKLTGLGNKMYFVSSDTDPIKTCDKNGNNCTSISLRSSLDHPGNAASNGVIPYTGQAIVSGYVYSVNIDVQVCKSAALKETNCVQYGSNYKPEGLIQKYSKSFKYSVFGYLNISNMYQDGAALRAQQKFVGPNTYDPIVGQLANAAKEWDPTNGVFIQNPDATDASNSSAALGTTISDSGVINYLNKFGEMNTGNDKSYDPVSEMYYAAVRYLKNQAPVASYSNITTYPDGTAYHMADGFPVITSSNDPIKYSCQKNFILGIGDANTHRDKNLPGNTNQSEEPAVPPEVSSDTTVNVVNAINRIGTIEGIAINTPFSGRNNSAYIAGLAYDVHTVDMRPDLTGMQTASTYWVDVEENQVLLPFKQNQYLLATKYGGFSVPAGYSPYTNTTAFPLSWWSTTGDILTTSNVNQSRPDNFFEGGNATSMRKGLNAAFSAIADANAGSSSSLSLNSTQLNNGSTIYQASYVEGAWSGALKAVGIDPVTQLPLSISPKNWAASLPAFPSRTVYTRVGTNYVQFNSTNVSGNGWTPDVVNYILGDSSNEAKNTGKTLRTRSTALGDVIDSQPVYVGPASPTLFSGATFTGSGAYAAYATTAAMKGRTPVVYVAANDGMVHGFDASNGANKGVEIYAYMPEAVRTAAVNPSVLAQANYGSGINPHQYFNDGELTVAEAYFSGGWHTVLVGTTGRGKAEAIYALDVTDPTAVTLLWEISGATNPDVGQIVGKPIIAQTSHGWVVLVGNGYNSTNGKAVLLSIPLDGSAATTYTTNATLDNGLATPGVWIASTANDISTTAYAGDLKGNVWSFDLSATSGAGTLVFSTPSNQPITSTIALGKDPSTGHLWAFFGTGKYLSIGDLSDKSVQSWYGMIVDSTLPVQQSDLVQRSIIAETSAVAANPLATPPTPAVSPSRAFTEGVAGDMAGKSGWYIDLVPPVGVGSPAIYEGERMLVSNQFVSGYLIGASLIPDTSDPCAPGGRGWVMALNPFTGTNPDDLFFDLNGDGVFDNHDRVTVGNNLVAGGGIGFGSLIGLPAFTGSSMFNNLNGLIEHTRINPAAGHGGRVSWREIVH